MWSLVDEWPALRQTRYVSALVIEEKCYDLGRYREHIQWFAVREQEKENLSTVPMCTLRDRPDYWERLGEWVLEDPHEMRSRMTLLNEHRARIDRITERMVLPLDYVE